LFAKLQSLRYSFAAVFGPANMQPFDAIRDVQANILTAASVLLEMAAFGQSVGKPNDGMMELRNTLGWGPRERPDTIDTQTEAAVETMEAICRPILSEKPQNSSR
jgi:hypothetical protein